jgi:hypothetical protein
MQWVRRGRLRMGPKLRDPCATEEHAATFSPPALASLVLGSCRSETGLYEIDSGGLARVRRGHGTRTTRADRDKLFRCRSNGSAGVCCGCRPAGPNEPDGLRRSSRPGRGPSAHIAPLQEARELVYSSRELPAGCAEVPMRSGQSKRYRRGESTDGSAKRRKRKGGHNGRR